MQAPLPGTPSREARLFVELAIHALVRAEQSGRLPERLSAPDPAKWAAFAGELGEPDLIEAAILDGAVPFPWAFDASVVLDEAPTRGILSGCPHAAHVWLGSARSRAGMASDDFLRWAADRLLPPGPKWGPPVPTAHAGDLILELPGTGGLFAYRIVFASADVFLQDSFVIACGSWRERLYAGLVALELTTPGGTTLNATVDPGLASSLVRERRFALIVGTEDRYGSVRNSLAELLLPGGELRLL